MPQTCKKSHLHKLSNWSIVRHLYQNKAFDKDRCQFVDKSDGSERQPLTVLELLPRKSDDDDDNASVSTAQHSLPSDAVMFVFSLLEKVCKETDAEGKLANKLFQTAVTATAKLCVSSMKLVLRTTRHLLSGNQKCHSHAKFVTTRSALI